MADPDDNDHVEDVRPFKRPADPAPGSAPKKLRRKSTVTITDLSEDDFSQITRAKVGKDDFDILQVLGSGAFAKVFLVRKRGGVDGGRLFAMKVLKKVKVVKDARSITNTKAERHILEEVNHPFIVNLCYAFQTDGKLYLVLEYKNGGELFSHLAKRGSFTEDETRFFAAELVTAIEHLHKLGIIYRDLKLENILLGSDGHLALTDFGLSKEYMQDPNDRAHSFAGTVEYMAPEMVMQELYNRSVDWWALGVLIFELLTGTPPFNNPDGKDNAQEQIIRRIKRHSPKYPRWFSDDLVDLLRGLLCKDQDRRLGSADDGARAIKNHPWFASVDWDAVLAKQLEPPIRPSVDFEADTANFDDYFTRQLPIDSPAQPLTATELFRGFSFVSPHVYNAVDKFRAPLPLVPAAPKVHIPADSEFLKKYELTDQVLGQGSYSVCRKCLSRRDGQFYAVKIVEINRRDPESEVSILRMCEGHPHIVQLVDVCRDQRHVYIVMELLRGGELFERIKRKKTFTENEARAQMRVLSQTVAFLHRNKIVHRDLKPENLLFASETDDTTLKLVDFGFAKLMAEDAPLKTPCFTPQYVAPEVLDADPHYDQSCDLWSLGVILYTMLCGHAPFHTAGRSSASLFEAVQHELKFPDTEWAHISDQAKNLVKRLLTVDPNTRITNQALLSHPWLRGDSDAELANTGDFDNVEGNIKLFHKVRPKLPLATVGASSLAMRRKTHKSTDSSASNTTQDSPHSPKSPAVP